MEQDFKYGRGTETSRRTLNIGVQAVPLKEADAFWRSELKTLKTFYVSKRVRKNEENAEDTAKESERQKWED